MRFRPRLHSISSRTRTTQRDKGFTGRYKEPIEIMKPRIHPFPTQQYLQECFLYNKDTGQLFWRTRPLSHFPSTTIAKSWNKQHAEREAFTTIHDIGYKIGNINHHTYSAHHIIWKLMMGENPTYPIRRQDKDVTNNRWKNLMPIEQKHTITHFTSPTEGICCCGYSGPLLDSPPHSEAVIAGRVPKNTNWR